jgi:TolA-binding protein
MTREIGAAFEDQVEVDAEDGARIARLAANAKQSLRKPVPGRALPIALLAACFSLIAFGAAAAVGWVKQRPVAAPGALATNAAWVATAAKPRVLEAAPQMPLPSASGSAEPSESAASLAVKAAAPQALHPPATAAQLFRKANDARRLGQAPHAIQLYRTLQRDFPSSAEAALSQVSLGGLLLNRASAGAALEQFDHYLAASPGAGLAAEALYGRARALQALARHSEEKRTWEQLLSRFPGCPYRETARRRLSELR